MKPWKNRLLVAATAPLLLVGCRTTGAKIAASAFTGSGDTFARDDDPELVRDAVPFALKTMESLLATIPEDVDLLRTLTADFTQYGYAFVQQDADVAEMEGRTAEARAGRERARKLFLRARDYGLRGLDELYPGISYRLRSARDLGPALDRVKKKDVDLLYWTAAAWALAIADGKSDMQLVSELPAPVAMMRRGLALDECVRAGRLPRVLRHLRGRPQRRRRRRPGGGAGAPRPGPRALGRQEARRRSCPGPRPSWSSSRTGPPSRPSSARIVAFDVDSAPEYRLANLIAQRRARVLLAHVDDLFA